MPLPTPIEAGFIFGGKRAACVLPPPDLTLAANENELFFPRETCGLESDTQPG